MFCKNLKLKYNGTVLTVPVRFDESASADEFNRRMDEVVKAERHVKKEQTNAAADLYGQAIKSLYNLIFGITQAGAIETFFNPDMFSMVCAVNPFIVGKIVPAVRKASAANMERAKREFLRQQRRRFKNEPV